MRNVLLDCGTMGIPDAVWEIHLAASRLEREESARVSGEDEGGGREDS